MKYTEKNPPIECLITQNNNYGKTGIIDIKGILWHSTGANNTKLSRYIQPSDNDPNKLALLQLIGTNANKNDWNHKNTTGIVHGFIGKLADGTVSTLHIMPYTYRPWGVGTGTKGSCNGGWIQFEICEDGLTDKKYFEQVYKEACEYTAYLCKLFNIDPNGTVIENGVKIPTILCHADSHKLGFGSNHSDVNHWFSKFGITMANARADVKKILDDDKLPLPEEVKPESKFKFKNGDMVQFLGGNQYTNANAATGSYVAPSLAKITAQPYDGEHPYHCRAIDEKGNFIRGVYGWVDANSVKALVEEKPEPDIFEVGDVVQFTGNTHYTNANAATGKTCKPGPAKIKQIYMLGKSKHPYNLVYVSGKGSTVNGWVDEKDVKR